MCWKGSAVGRERMLRTRRAVAGAVAAGAVVCGGRVCASAQAAVHEGEHPSTTTVSLTFDDGFADQKEGAALLRRHGMHGTFFVNSGNLDQPGRLSWADLHLLVADGNEIGGHT